MTSTVLMRTLSWLHRAGVRVSGGRWGGTLVGLPSLELVTVGRRSGKPRSSMLTAPLTLGRTLVVVASAGGNDEHPSWFLNLRDHPQVRVGVSPRGVIALTRAASAYALINGRGYVLPEDFKALVEPVFAHRVLLSPDAQLRGVTAAEVLDDAVRSVPVPLPDNQRVGA